MKITPSDINRIPERRANQLARTTLRCIREALADPIQKAEIDRRIQRRGEERCKPLKEF